MAIRLSVGPALAFSDAVSPTTLPSDAAPPSLTFYLILLTVHLVVRLIYILCGHRLAY